MIRARVLGSSLVKAKLDSVRSELPDTLGRQRLGEFLLRRMRARFLQQVDPNGNKWTPLSPKTAIGRGILYKTGQLYRSIDIIDGNQQGRFAVATGAGFRIGVQSNPYVEYYKTSSRQVDPAIYGRYHQLGIGVPKRRFIGLSATDRKAIADLVRRELRKAVAK